eukprot:Amastigsp_a339819_35.p2 type:complete len:122 gc:universal Amastigsp_a339819_35:672-307(-)
MGPRRRGGGAGGSQTQVARGHDVDAQRARPLAPRRAAVAAAGHAAAVRRGDRRREPARSEPRAACRAHPPQGRVHRDTGAHSARARRARGQPPRRDAQTPDGVLRGAGPRRDRARRAPRLC